MPKTQTLTRQPARRFESPLMSASLILMVSVCLYLAMGVPVAFALGLSTVTALGVNSLWRVPAFLKR